MASVYHDLSTLVFAGSLHAIKSFFPQTLKVIQTDEVQRKFMYTEKLLRH